MNKSKHALFAFCVMPLFIVGCATQTGPTYRVKASNVAAGETQALQSNDAPESEAAINRSRVMDVSALSLARNSAPVNRDPSMLFSDSEQVVFAAEQLPLKDFVNNLFSELLQKSYVVAKDVTVMEETVTLNIKEPVSKRQAYRMAVELLQKQGVAIAEKEGVFYLAQATGQGQSALGVGARSVDVPNVAGTVIQVVPLKFNNSTLESTITQFVPVRVTRDMQMNSLFITGNYPDVVRALELVRMMDVPANRGRYVRVLRLTYLGPDEFSKKLATLLESEGVDGIGVGSPVGRSTVLVPIEHIGAVAVFSNNETFVERAQYWAEQIDVPGEGVQKRYFIYHPAYARATDLGQSVASLLGQSNTAGNQSRDTSTALGNQTSSAEPMAQSANASSNNGGRGNSVSVQNERISMTVDERSNTLIFYTEGSEYQALLPMIKRLDVMPKQVLLEATIAEVTLTDDFAMGVEFAFKNGKLSGGTLNSLGAGTIGGLNLGYVSGTDSILARFEQSNQLVNVLSNPYLVVRDGVAANINVGSEIPTVSSTTQDPILSDKQTTNISYKQTGLEFTVLPTINGQGLVVMQIKQNISNQAEGSVVDGAPAIFKRTLETEVLAQSGQTILLGGLISENDDSGNTSVPFLADLPLLGNLFKSQTKKKIKTELVLLITPRVIDAAEHWHYINGQLQQGFKHLQIAD